MMWNESTRSASSWTRGTYFIAYPKIAAGPDHEAAVNAGGTWGTPWGFTPRKTCTIPKERCAHELR